jgi:alkanesulfonate monooxygenase SsuD/methylene tetrahydromethanopterin reductase-like flavin-dependent oxidoreductase (luciferase family)
MGHPPRFGICPDQNLPFETLVERWQYYERLGLDSLWVCDHFNQPSRPTGPYFEGWTTLAALALRTDRVRIGVLVSSNTFRHPALLAQEAITVDHISRGRLDLGLGAGWFEPEHERFGIRLPPPGERVARFEEAVQIIDSLLRNESTTFDGEYYRLAGAYLRPRPIQAPRPPLTLAGHKPRMLGICARHADAWNSIGSPTEIAKRNRLLDERAGEIGRDPLDIRRGIFAWASQLTAWGIPDPWESVAAFEDVFERYRTAGVDDFILDQPRPDQFPTLERVASDVIPRLRRSSTDAVR